MKRDIHNSDMWQKGYLDDHGLQALITIMIFMCGLYFVLQSGAEHSNLHHKSSQITLFEPTCQRAYLRYVEDVSKITKVDSNP